MIERGFGFKLFPTIHSSHVAPAGLPGGGERKEPVPEPLLLPDYITDCNMALNAGLLD